MFQCLPLAQYVQQKAQVPRALVVDPENISRFFSQRSKNSKSFRNGAEPRNSKELSRIKSTKHLGRIFSPLFSEKGHFYYELNKLAYLFTEMTVRDRCRFSGVYFANFQKSHVAFTYKSNNYEILNLNISHLYKRNPS